VKLKEISEISSGYMSRGKIEACSDGEHLLLQARDVDGSSLACKADTLMPFKPNLSGKDSFLKQGDLLFMARGRHNFTVLLEDIPDSTLAAACFFIIKSEKNVVLPEYLWWYLNQAPVKQYLKRNSGKGVHMPVVRRAVLENMDIPLPPLAKQEIIAKLAALQSHEQELINCLMEKRKKIIVEACLQAITKN
jgi:hypothetical protein